MAEKTYKELLDDLASYNERTKTATATYEANLGDIANAVSQVTDARNEAEQFKNEAGISAANAADSEQVLTEYVDNFESTFIAQFAYKHIGNISDYVGQQLQDADRLNAYQYPDDSDDWYGPIQSQAFPITIPANPASSGDWVLISALTIGIADNRYTTTFKNDASGTAVENMIAGRVNGVAGSVVHRTGNIYSTGGTNWECLVDGNASAISDFTALGAINVKDFGAIPGSGNNSYTAFITAANYAKNKNATLFIPGEYWEVTPAVDLSGVSVELEPSAVVVNPSGFPFIVEGNGWGYPNQQLTQLPEGISFVKTRHGVAKFTTATTPETDWKAEDMAAWRMDCYANAELDASVGSASGAAVMRTYFESGRQEQTSGSGGHLVADWQVYNMSGETPLGTRSEITPLSIGVVMREKDLDTDPTGNTDLNQPHPFNVYNELSIHGSSFNVEDYLSGACIAVNKYTPGTFVGGSKKGSDGLSVVTTPTLGAFNGQISKSKDPADGTFALRSGVHIAGFAGALGAGYPTGGHELHARSAYDVALRLGGFGCGVWNPNPSTQRSKYQDGIDIRDFTRYAINIESQHPDKTDVTVPAIRVTKGAGEVIHGDPVRPLTDDSTTIGKPSFRYSDIFSVNAANNTSDQRLKTTPDQFPDDVLDAIGDVELINFKWLDAVSREQEGGSTARNHAGVIAQQLKEAFESRDLNPHEWGCFCYDEWDDIYETVEADIEWTVIGIDINGHEIWGEKVISEGRKVLVKPSGNLYSIRYSELLVMFMAHERRERKKLEEKINQLMNS